MKRAVVILFAVFALLYVVRVPLHDVLFPEETAMYAERAKAYRASNF